MTITPSEIIANLLKLIDSTECLHDSTHQAGTIWEVCDQCDRRWERANGKPVYVRPPAVEQALNFLQTSTQHVNWEARWLNPENKAATASELAWKPVKLNAGFGGSSESPNHAVEILKRYEYDGKPCYEVRVANQRVERQTVDEGGYWSPIDD